MLKFPGLTFWNEVDIHMDSMQDEVLERAEGNEDKANEIMNKYVNHILKLYTTAHYTIPKVID